MFWCTFLFLGFTLVCVSAEALGKASGQPSCSAPAGGRQRESPNCAPCFQALTAQCIPHDVPASPQD